MKPTALRLPILLAAAALVSLPATAAEGLPFERVFNPDHEPAHLHFKADYLAGGQSHRVEVWRDGQRRLRRRTDDAIETIVTKGDDDAFQMQVYDLRRGMQTRISRDSLMRIGRFVDWFGLAHGLSQPAGDVLVIRAERPRDAAGAIDACEWYAMGQSRICWSATWRLPLLITDPAGQVQWRAVAVDTEPMTDAVFTIAAPGFVVNDANADIQGD